MVEYNSLVKVVLDTVRFDLGELKDGLQGEESKANILRMPVVAKMVDYAGDILTYGRSKEDLDVKANLDKLSKIVEAYA